MRYFIVKLVLGIDNTNIGLQPITILDILL